MTLSAGEVADLKKKWQYFVVQFVAFPAISWTLTEMSPGAITWQPFCLLAPRFAFTTGASVTIDGSDSYIRPTTSVATVTFAKASGTGTVTDNADKTCTVSSGTGLVVVEATATSGGETAVSYANVFFGDAGNLATAVARCEGFSGSIATGEWQADLILKGDYSGELTSDGRDQPILMHVTHYWDGSADTFGGYKRHNNTFVLLCRDASVRVNNSGDYETALHLETPAYVLKQSYLIGGEMRFGEDSDSGDYYTASLTPTDVAYYILREGTNLHQYFDMSLWNNSSTINNFTVRGDANYWDAVRDTVGYNFGLLYFDRWGSLVAKPDPRMRITDWQAIQSEVFDTTNPLTTGHLLEYTLFHRQVQQVGRVSMQAVLPDMTIIDVGVEAASIGEAVSVNSLVATSEAEVEAWANQYYYWLNTEYELDMRMGMGHELNPGDLFYTAEIDPPIGDTIATDAGWFVDDINYEFDFSRGFWTRRIHSVLVAEGGG